MIADDEPPLVGRTDEVRRLRAAVRAGRGAVVAGEAGVGKTRLLRVLAAAAVEDGLEVRFVAANAADEGLPLGALSGLAAPGGRGEDTPPVLFVDDAQELDRTSAALILRLAVGGGAQVVAGLRTGGSVPASVTRLWRDTGAVRVDLSPLADADMRTLLEGLLDGDVERSARAWLLGAARGNPLYLDELVRAARAGDALVLHGGSWRRVGAVVPSPRLHEIVDERLGHLDTSQQRVLALVALAEPIALGTLERLGALRVARDLEERGLVAAADGEVASLRAAHPLYAEIARARLGAVEGRELRAALAAVLPRERLATRRLLATWALQDERLEDPALLAEMAEDALGVLDPERAVALGRAALAGGAGVDAVVTLAVALRATGEAGEAEALLAANEDAVRGTNVAAAYLFNRAMGLQWGLRRQEDALALLQRAQGWAPGTEWRAIVRQIAATLLVTSGRLADGLVLAEPLLELADVSDVTRLRLALVAGYALPLLGRPEEARDVLARARARCAPGFAVEWPTETVEVACAIVGADGWVEAEAELRGVREAALATHAFERATVTEMSLVRLATLRGDFAGARTLATDAVERFSLMDPREHAATCMAELATAAVEQDGAAAARAVLARCEELRRTWPASRASTHRYGLAEAAVLGAEGRPLAAQRRALAVADEAGEALLWEAEALFEHVRLGGRPAAIRARLSRLAEAAPRTIVTLWARHVRAAGDGAALEAVAADWERVGARHWAGEAAAQAIAAHTVRGDASGAARARSRSRHLASRHGLDDAGERAARMLAALRPREREVARLVALRLSNAEVAERLSLSVRTVESHVYRATTRLGVRSRAELADAVRAAVVQ